MALISCPDCKRQVSTAASSCPQCGHVLSRPPEGFVNKLFRSGCWLLVLGACALLVLFVLFVGLGNA